MSNYLITNPLKSALLAVLCLLSICLIRATTTYNSPNLLETEAFVMHHNGCFDTLGNDFTADFVNTYDND